MIDSPELELVQDGLNGRRACAGHCTKVWCAASALCGAGPTALAAALMARLADARCIGVVTFKRAARYALPVEEVRMCAN